MRSTKKKSGAPSRDDADEPHQVAVGASHGGQGDYESRPRALNIDHAQLENAQIEAVAPRIEDIQDNASGMSQPSNVNRQPFSDITSAIEAARADSLVKFRKSKFRRLKFRKNNFVQKKFRKKKFRTLKFRMVEGYRLD